MIISASRRTDIPAFYGEWLMNRLGEGFVLTRNPFNPRQCRRISLLPGDVDALVLWTKDPAPLLPRLPEITGSGIPVAVQFTLTPYGRELEPGLRDKAELIATFRELSRLLGRDRVWWRYDPILFNGDGWDFSRHIAAFRRLSAGLAGYTAVCTISFVDMYAKIRPAERAGRVRPVPPEQRGDLATALAAAGREQGITLRACCEKMDLSGYGVLPGACIGREEMERLCGHPLPRGRDPGQRSGCGCMSSVDIGSYRTCRHGCVYCYAGCAAPDARHDPAAPSLDCVKRP